MHPFNIVNEFEDAVAEYTGADYCVALNSCTNAIFLCLEWQKQKEYRRVNAHHGFTDVQLPKAIEIPKHTYIGVAQSIINTGFDVKFRDEIWQGNYQLKPFYIWDAAKQFHKYMFRRHMVHFHQNTSAVYHLYMCTSHHWTKILGIQQGGCILTNDKDAAEWFERARCDGRTPGLPASKEKQPIRGWHCYMSPEVAAEGLVRLYSLPNDNPDQPVDNYPDLSQMEIFK